MTKRVAAGAGNKSRSSNPARARSVDGRRPDRRAQLLEAALELFAERPYEDISVDEVCTRAGVAHGLLSYYFGGKRGLFAAAVKHAWADLVSYERPLVDEVTAVERIRGYLERHFEYAREHPARFQIMMRTGHADEQINEILRAARTDAVREISVSLGCPVNAPPLLRSAIRGWTGYVDSVTLDLIDDDELTVDGLTEMCVQVLVASVRGATGVLVDAQDEIDALSQIASMPRGATPSRLSVVSPVPFFAHGP